jgi:cytochrome bd-type quinol oxidase subunit 2
MEVPPKKLAAGGLVAALLLTLLFAYSYVGALHDPHPQRMPIAVTDPRAASAVESSGGPFVPRSYPNERAVRAALRRRDVLVALLPAVIVSGLAGVTTLVLVYRRRYEPARYVAALAVAALTAGWALSRWPTILPGLTVDQAAAGHDTLVCVVVAVLMGPVILFPALALLFRLTLAGRFRAPESTVRERSATKPGGARIRMRARFAVACLIAGFGLLTVADDAWAHAVGVVCLIGFVVVAFGAIAVPALDTEAATP